MLILYISEGTESESVPNLDLLEQYRHRSQLGKQVGGV